jgi:predicted lipid-binding transport protein (Tim44 family)
MTSNSIQAQKPAAHLSTEIVSPKDPGKVEGPALKKVWPTVVGVLIGIVATAAVVAAVIFFAPGVLGLFLAFAGVLYGGILGTVLAGVATGAACALVGGLAGYGVAKLIQGLAQRANAAKNSTPPASESGNAASAGQPKQPENASNDAGVAPGGLTPADQTTRETFLELIREGRWQLNQVPPPQTSWEQRRQEEQEQIRQKVVTEHFCRQVPNQKDDPLGFELYEKHVALCVADAELESIGETAEPGDPKALVMLDARRKCEAIKKEIEGL